jgi:ribosomal protein S12 methylthiotransferase accessory factor
MTEGCTREPSLPKATGDRFDHMLDALRAAGAQAVIVVPLHSDPSLGVHVVRVVAPPLAPTPDH